MSPNDRLTDVFDRGLRNGVERLASTERDLYFIQDFILEREQNGLDGYFYNRLPDVAQIQATVDAMRRHGLPALAHLLSTALDLFRGYVDPSPPATWREVRRRYDPADRLGTIDGQIRALPDYGLAESQIA